MTDQPASDPSATAYDSTASDATTHRPALVGCSCGLRQPMPEPLTLAYCLEQATYWLRQAAEIGQAMLVTADEVATAEYWRQRAVEAERELKAMKDLDSKQIV